MPPTKPFHWVNPTTGEYEPAPEGYTPPSFTYKVPVEARGRMVRLTDRERLYLLRKILFAIEENHEV
jgi:hypothetical protein